MAVDCYALQRPLPIPGLSDQTAFVTASGDIVQGYGYLEQCPIQHIEREGWVYKEIEA